MTDAHRPQTRQFDQMDPARAQAMQATLGEEPTLSAGDPLPDFFHQLYFWTPMTPHQLGRDGHPARGQGVIPDLGLPRRMWAGGRLGFHKPLVLGRSAECITTLEQAVCKDGRSGPLGVVTVSLEYHQNDTLCLREERDLIYREDAMPDAPTRTPPSAPEGGEFLKELRFDTTQLFRYSALTFNGHRIHYDVDYAQHVEGYSGLVVHGPLLAQNLVIAATEALGPLARFSFRATSPLMHFETATIHRDGTQFWIAGPDGQQCMEAKAVPQ